MLDPRLASKATQYFQSRPINPQGFNDPSVKNAKKINFSTITEEEYAEILKESGVSEAYMQKELTHLREYKQRFKDPGAERARRRAEVAEKSQGVMAPFFDAVDKVKERQRNRRQTEEEEQEAFNE